MHGPHVTPTGSTPAATPPARPAAAPRPQAAARPVVKPDEGNGLRVLTYLRLHWLMILFCGTLLGGAGAYAAWELLASKYESYALLQVSSVPATVASGGNREQARTDFVTYLKTTSALIKSEFVLNAALRDIKDLPDSGRLFAAHVIHDLWKYTDGKALVVTDVGQHQMWEAQYYKHDHPRKLVTSGGAGTMGFALPAAMGARFACPDDQIWVIAGDGGFQMTACELATCAQEGIKVNIAVINNGYLGMVRQWQELTYGSRYAESYTEALPNFVKLAEAYGWKGLLIDKPDQLESGIEAMLAHDGPVMVDCRVAKLANCLPMIPSGAAHTEMILQANEVSGEMDDEAKALV